VLWLYALATLRQWKSLVAFTVGVAVASIVLLWYQWAAFGNPFTPGYRFEIYEPFRAAHAEPLLVGRPYWAVLPMLLFSPARGLFVYAPVALAAVASSLAMLLGRQRTLALVSLGSLAGLLLVNVSHRFWEGGLATGPRHLLPAVPLLMLPLAAWLGRTHKTPENGKATARRFPSARAMSAVLVLSSIVGAFIITACTADGGRLLYPTRPGTTAFAPDWNANPLAAQVFPDLREGRLARNLGGMLFGESAPWWQQLAPLAGIWLVFGTALAWSLRQSRQATAKESLPGR
jgi:hypothetical protein